MAATAFLFLLFALIGNASHAAETFTNPIAKSGADPWMIQHGDDYFLVQSHRNGIAVARAASPVEIGKSRWVMVWTPPAGKPYSKEVWAPELHYLQSKWYIYTAADDGDNNHHRIYVLEGTTQNPQDPFIFKGELKLPEDRWAIDGSMFTYSNRMFFIWSGWAGAKNVDQRIYIAELSDPLTVKGDRTCISVPQYDWEKRDGPPWVNEGPEALQHDGHLFIIYSAAGSWADNYCLGQVTFRGGNPLQAESWYKKPAPVFSRTKDVYGPGHCCFVKSPDGTEDWIIYHAAKYPGAGWNRNLRAQKFTWNADGSPDFGTPAPINMPLRPPSGSINRP